MLKWSYEQEPTNQRVLSNFNAQSMLGSNFLPWAVVQIKHPSMPHTLHAPQVSSKTLCVFSCLIRSVSCMSTSQVIQLCECVLYSRCVKATVSKRFPRCFHLTWHRRIDTTLKHCIAAGSVSCGFLQKLHVMKMRDFLCPWVGKNDSIYLMSYSCKQAKHPDRKVVSQQTYLNILQAV